MALDWDTAIRRLIIEVVAHHDRVMFEKGRLESCWIHQQDSRLMRDQDYRPYYRASRHEQAIQILVDLGLVRLGSTAKDATVSLTGTGKTLLRRVLTEASHGQAN